MHFAIGGIRYLLNVTSQVQQPAVTAIPIGALSRYDRPQPTLEDYERLRPNWVATEVIQ